MRLQGEYWITDSGTWFADGTIGDLNHSGYALDHARRLLLQEIGARDDSEFMDDTSFHFAISQEMWRAEFTYPDDYSLRDALLAWKNAGGVGFDEDLLAACFEVGDIREFAMKHWGWRWVKQMWVGTHTLTLDDFKDISSGMQDAAEEEGAEIEDHEEVEIAVMNGKRYYIEWHDLIADNYNVLGISQAVPNPERCDQVARLDQQSIPSCYNGKSGD